MYVVRLKRPDEDFDLKVFGTKKEALKRFRAAQAELIDGAIEECALFQAEATDAGRAVEMVNQGHAILIESNLEDPRSRPPVRKSRTAKTARGKAKKRTTR